MLNPNTDEFSHDQTIFDLTPFPMWIYDLETYRFLKVNNEAIRHYGYTGDEFLKMTIKDIRPKEDIPKLEKAVKEASMRSEQYKESLYRHQKKNGDIMYVQIKSNLIDYRGKKAEIVTAIDLSDRHEQEQILKAQKEYLRAIDSINRLLLKTSEWLKSLKGCFKIVGDTIDVDRIYFFEKNQNQQTISQRLEWSRDNIDLLIDHPDFQNIPFSQLALLMEPLQKQRHFEAIVPELPPSPTKEILTQRMTMSTLVFPIWINDEFCGLVGFDYCRQKRTFTDDEFQFLHTLTSNLGHVIKRQQAYEKLSYSEGRFKSLIENGKDLIGIVDEKGNYKYVAPTSKTVLGIAPEEFLGKNAFDFIYEEDIPRLKPHLDKILESKYVSIEPYRFPDADGNWRWVRTELVNHLNTPLIEGIVANTHDVTAEVEKKIVDDLAATLTLAISQPGSLVSCLSEALSSLIKLSKICVSEIWLTSTDNTRLDLISKACQDESFNSFYQDSKDITSFDKGLGLPGRIWNDHEALSWKDIHENKHFLRSKAAKAANLNTAIGIPLMYNNTFLGCIVCLSEFEEGQLTKQIGLLTQVSEQLGAVIKQKVTEEEYRNFFNISPDPHCVVGFDGKIKKFNKAFIELLGYKEKQLLNQPIFQFIHHEDLSESIKRLENSIKGNKVSDSFEARFLNNKGQTKWLVWTGTVIPESKLYIAAAKDITEQKKAEQNLQKAYDRLKTAQKIAKLGYWVRELDAETYIWGEETYKIYEFTQQNFTPTMESIKQTFHPEDRYLIENNPIERLEPNKVQSYEHRIITGSGKIKWVHQEVRLVTNNDGVAIQIEGTIQDITESKKYEEQLSISNDRFKLAMQASNEMIWEIDHHKQKIIRGKSYKDTFKYGKSEAFSKQNSWFSKIHDQDRDKVWNSINKAYQNKRKKSWKAEYRVQSADGSVAYFEDRCYILRDKNGSPIRSVGSTLDVTTSRQQLKQIQEQNDNLREIAWLQSHVIRAPLSRIMGLAYLSSELDGGGKSHDEIMAMITDSANELDEVIHQITEKTNKIKDEDMRNITD